MRIQVTQEDIDKGQRVHPIYCPIARAIKRHAHKPVRVLADTGITVGGKQYRHTAGSLEFVERFDMGQPVKPFEFELRREK